MGAATAMIMLLLFCVYAVYVSVIVYNVAASECHTTVVKCCNVAASKCHPAVVNYCNAFTTIMLLSLFVYAVYVFYCMQWCC